MGIENIINLTSLSVLFTQQDSTKKVIKQKDKQRDLMKLTSMSL